MVITLQRDEILVEHAGLTVPPPVCLHYEDEHADESPSAEGEGAKTVEVVPHVVQWLIAVIGVGGVGGLVIALRKSKSDGKKADTANTLALAGSTIAYAQKLERRLDEVSAAFDKFRREQEARNRRQEARNRLDDRLKLTHSLWDARAASEIRALGGHIEDPPPLFQTEGTAK